MIWSGGSKPMKQELPSWHSSIVVWVSWIVIADRRDELWKKHMFCVFFCCDMSEQTTNSSSKDIRLCIW